MEAEALRTGVTEQIFQTNGIPSIIQFLNNINEGKNNTIMLQLIIVNVNYKVLTNIYIIILIKKIITNSDY